MAKTIFNSSEKSNFILNMTEEKYSDLASKGLAAACFLVPLFTIPAECSENIGFSFAAGGLAVSGVICLILALIALIKKYISRSMIIPVGAFGAMLVWGIISLISSYDTTISFYGTSGRGEGLLAIAFYFGFFITGMTIKTKKAASVLINSVIAVGALNSVWGLLQIFIPGMPSNYKFISTMIQANAASGLSQSPIFLAMLLSLSLTAALIGFIMSESKKKRIICIICTCLFSFVMIFTYTLAGVCGIILSVIMAAAAVFITKAPKIRLASIGAAAVSAAAALIIAEAGLVGDGSGYKLYDGNIMWWDSYIRLSASGLYDNDKVDISDTADVYSFMTAETLEIIGEYPLAGTGPDQLIYPQLYKSAEIIENVGTFDRNYNEYLYTAATRGIPSLIALLAVIVSLIWAGFRGLRSEKNEITVSLFFILICGTAIFLIGNSNIAFSPVFWAAAGASCASFGTERTVSGKNNKKQSCK